MFYKRQILNLLFFDPGFGNTGLIPGSGSSFKIGEG
jgi:hypothetical protein